VFSEEFEAAAVDDYSTESTLRGAHTDPARLADAMIGGVGGVEGLTSRLAVAAS